MTTSKRGSRWLATLAVLCAVSGAQAQVIRVKTIPVAESEQFALFPTAGRIGTSIVLTDSLLDPFRNPARGAALKSSAYFGSPSFFAVSENAGGGTTFPVGMMMRRGRSFGAFAAAFQEIDRAEPQGGGFFGPTFAPDPSGFETQRGPDNNRYFFGLLGRSFGRTSIAASALWSGLKSVDGVDQFYSGNRSLVQSGDASDVRLGVTRELDNGRSLEVVALRNRFGMSHDVGFVDFFWDPGLRQPVATARHESNGEQSSRWGLHVEYEQPIDSSWRMGWLATTNVITMSRIPQYEITQGLGRQGDATAFNFGAGIGRVLESISFGADAIYEPIVSRTWVRDTVENRFMFHNASLRGGFAKEFKLLTPGSSVRAQVSAEFNWINYRLKQDDLVNTMQRTRKESWLERGRGAGLSFLTPSLQLHYQVHSLSGVGRPGVISNQGLGVVDEISTAPWMPQQQSAAVLGAVSVTRHQFSISVPVR